METVNWDTRQQKSQWAAHGRMFLNQTGPSRCKPSQAFRLCNLILFKTEWINPMAWPQKKLLRHSARQKYQNCFHMQEKKKMNSRLDVWKRSLTGSDRRSWSSCCCRVLQPAQSLWQDSCSLHSKRLAAYKHFHSLFQHPEEKPGYQQAFSHSFSRNSPNILQFIWYVIWGWVLGF